MLNADEERVHEAISWRGIDDSKMVTLLREIADEGSRYAGYFYGMCLLEGTGTAMDSEEAIRILMALTDQDDEIALDAKLGMVKFYAHPQQPDEQKANALKMLQGIFERQKQSSEAVSLLYALAQTGFEPALTPAFKLANKNEDYGIALTLLPELVKTDLDYQYTLAEYHFHGLGTPKNLTKAWELYSKALAESKSTVRVWSAKKLAKICLEGDSANPDYELAAKYLSYAAHSQSAEVVDELKLLIEKQQGYAHWGMFRYYVSLQPMRKHWVQASDSLHIGALMGCQPAKLCHAVFQIQRGLREGEKTLTSISRADPLLGTWFAKLLSSGNYAGAAMIKQEKQHLMVFCLAEGASHYLPKKYALPLKTLRVTLKCFALIAYLRKTTTPNWIVSIHARFYGKAWKTLITQPEFLSYEPSIYDWVFADDLARHGQHEREMQELMAELGV